MGCVVLFWAQDQRRRESGTMAVPAWGPAATAMAATIQHRRYASRCNLGGCAGIRSVHGRHGRRRVSSRMTPGCSISCPRWLYRWLAGRADGVVGVAPEGWPVHRVCLPRLRPRPRPFRQAQGPPTPSKALPPPCSSPLLLLRHLFARGSSALHSYPYPALPLSPSSSLSFLLPHLCWSSLTNNLIAPQSFRARQSRRSRPISQQDEPARRRHQTRTVLPLLNFLYPLEPLLLSIRHTLPAVCLCACRCSPPRLPTRPSGPASTRTAPACTRTSRLRLC
ncbi:hypothetical protein CC80DRAFT_569873 [Byssothecium circinans]|uniref:Uncharacterized protein n=1 Tax=Byssothecium circinans TaxID=147558 RepID=A0A6A5UB75_9PLEO|nr:hypothetical protein CC80DRAFT_569873 [Byssothecium circinans]